jgi:hypothetical protein
MEKAKEFLEMRYWIRVLYFTLAGMAVCLYSTLQWQTAVAAQPSTSRHTASNIREPSTAQLRLDRQRWVAKCLREMESIKVGMSRKDLSKVFSTEGGVSSPCSRHYVHRECPYFKVNIEFATSRGADGRRVARPNDKITKVSRPYVQWSILD